MTTKLEVATPTVAQVVMSGPVPPDIARQMAEEEVDRDLLRQYVDTIHVLREKGFSYREIAEWLSDRGVDVDHNEVYRTYMEYCEGRDGGPSAMEQEMQRQQDEAEHGRGD